MEKWADYLVSKEKWVPNTNRIDSFIIYIDEVDKVSSKSYEVSRIWVVQQLNKGMTFCCIYRSEKNGWYKGSYLTLSIGGGLNWNDNLPFILPKRKSFISYYHKDDIGYKEKFENLTYDLITSKSVKEGDIASDVSNSYTKQLIQNGYLDDTTVLIVLLGEKTKCRKHVDWEISGALDYKVGDTYAGLLGLKLPSHSDYGTGRYSYSKHPQRLVDNLKSQYAIIRDYTTDRRKLQEYIELAFGNRIYLSRKDNSRIQMKINTCS